MMSPARTPAGYFVIDIDWSRTLGFRIARSSETKSLREHNAIVALLYELRENGQEEVLRLFARNRIPVAVLKQAKRHGRLKSDTLLTDLSLLQALWHNAQACPKRSDPAAPHSTECIGAVDKVLPRMGRSPETRRRYATSLTKLRRVGKRWLPANALVKDLEKVDWHALRAEWEGSPADWNHMVRALSTFLSKLLGDVYHPTRRRIITRIERETEEPRTPSWPGDLFWRIVEAAPEHARPCYVVLGASGMRTGEYLKARPDGLDHDAHTITTRGKTGPKRYAVDPRAWAWAEIGIPSPLKYRWMRIYWIRACVAAGAGRFEPHPKGTREFNLFLHPELARAGREKGESLKAHRRREAAKRTALAALPKVRYVGPTMHDVRHLYAQASKQQGTPTTDTMNALGQKTPGITRMYEAEENKREVAGRVWDELEQRRGPRRVG